MPRSRVAVIILFLFFAFEVTLLNPRHVSAGLAWPAVLGGVGIAAWRRWRGPAHRGWKVSAVACWRSMAELPRADVALAAGLIFVFEAPGFNPYRHDSGSWWAFAGAVAAGAVAWRRVHPVRVWAIATGVSAWLLANRSGTDWGALSPLVVFPAPLAALYTVTYRGGTRWGGLALAGSGIALGSGLLWDSYRPEDLLIVGTMLGIAWALGESSRSRREAVAALQERAAALEDRAAAFEAERAERDCRAAADERSRIARELHDIVAHHVSVIALQAGTARLLAESGQAPGTKLLAGIESTSRLAMTELRQALGVIRYTADGSDPLPGMDRLPELTGRMGRAGLAVTVDGSAGPLSGALDLTAYRVVQEGLTNVLRHSAARTALVTLRRSPSSLDIVVADDGPPRPAAALPPGGHGLIGLRERAAAFDGRVCAGARPGGGFELSVRLPLATEGTPALAAEAVPRARVAGAR
jgi:signal transduction histidine kinase